MKTDAPAKLITLIIPKGKANELQQALADEKGLHSADFHRARGVGRFSALKDRGIGEQQEKEILNISVREGDAEEIFEYLFFKARLNEPHGGIMYMTSLPVTTLMEMPDLPKESSGS